MGDIRWATNKGEQTARNRRRGTDGAGQVSAGGGARVMGGQKKPRTCSNTGGVTEESVSVSDQYRCRL